MIDIEEIPNLKDNYLKGLLNVISKVTVPFEDGDTISISPYKNALLFFYHGVRTNPQNGTTSNVVGQFEIPLSGLDWFIFSIENKFMKTSREGGLPKGKFHCVEVIDGEKLCITRASALGINREPGYCITNMTRRDPVSDMGKKQCFTDTLLFKENYFKELKKVLTLAE